MALGDVIRTFPAGIGAIRDMTFDGKNLWIVDDTTNRIYCFDRFTGAQIRSIPAPVTSVYGLTFDGKNLWLGDYISPSSIWCLDLNGNVLWSFNTAFTNTGLAFDGKNLWDMTQSVPRTTYCLDRATGAVITGFPIGAGGSGLTFDGKSLWGQRSGVIRSYDRATGAILTVTTVTPILGLAFDGKYLWSGSANTVYQLSMG